MKVGIAESTSRSTGSSESLDYDSLLSNNYDAVCWAFLEASLIRTKNDNRMQTLSGLKFAEEGIGEDLSILSYLKSWDAIYSH